MRLMSRAFTLAIIAVACWALSLRAAEPAPAAVIDYVNAEVAQLGADQVIIDAVVAQNAQRKTLDEIKAADEKWINTPGVDDTMQALMDSECAKHLRQLQAESGFIAELFVTDNKGAIVAMTDKTSDYWQGDEAKFTEAFNNGQGAVFIDSVEFDDSCQAYLVQASVPVKNGDRVIGVVTIGIDIDAFEGR